MGHTALITGASAGLGVEFARLFAADGHDVVLVARRKDRLDALASELAAKHKVKTWVIAADLTRPETPAAIVAEVKRLGLEIEYLVNNAGFGTDGSFHTINPEKELGQVHCNVSSLVALTGAFLPAMVARGHGRVLNVGSTAGMQATGPYMATYYATKSFVNSFTQSLAYELQGTGVTATLSCPGPTATEFFDAAGARPLFTKLGMMSAEKVARSAYHAMNAGKPKVIHGLLNWLVSVFAPLTPRALLAVLNKSPSAKALRPG
jgi:short-subunit dehydrogenase